MLLLIRKIVGITAIYVIALNTILAAALPVVPAAAAFDRFLVICHSGTQGAAEAGPTSDGQPAKPGKACDHCTLCGATPPPSAPVDNVLAGLLGPSSLVAALQPVETPRRIGVVATSNLARGPPLSA